MDGDDFADEIVGRSAWVEGVLSDVEFLETQKRPNGGFGGGGLKDAHVYRAGLTVSKRLFCRDPLPPTLTFAEVRVPLHGFWDGERFRQPQNGERVFAHVWQTESGEWECQRIGIPIAAERERVDRVRSILYEGSARQAAQQLLDGCCDQDPFFAIWCMNALKIADDDDIGTQKEVYGRFREQVTVDRYRAALLEALETPQMQRKAFLHAAYLLRSEWKPAAEEDRFYAASLERLRNFFAQPHVRPDGFQQDEPAALIGNIYQTASVPRRLEVLKLLVEQADNPLQESRIDALLWAAYLHTGPGEDAALNEAIFRFYRDQIPLRAEDADVATNYWYGLNSYLERETRRRKQLCDAVLDLYEQKWPFAQQGEARVMAQQLEWHYGTCIQFKVEVARYASRLQSLYAMSATAEQRALMGETLRKLNIPLPDKFDL